ncbi:MAG: DnaJ domain-containing protein [Alphaproteobacteria bacterium]
MGAWDKIIGGAAGFMVGGPLGAVLGATAGHLAGKVLGDMRALRDGPYDVLGVAHDASDDQVKAAHRRLAWRLHPDRVAARGEGPAAIGQASDRLARVNDAYDRIRRERRLGP